MALATSDFPQPTTLSSRRPYTYTKICDLQSGSKMTNVMGVVSLFKAPYMSRGTDYSCTVDLVDEGCPTHSFPVIFFSRNVDKLPQTCCVGDVLCVRGVDIAQFNQRLQGKCRSLFSWLLWDGKRKGRKDPARSSDGSFWDSYEVDRAEQLIRWTTSLNSGESWDMPRFCTDYII